MYRVFTILRYIAGLSFISLGVVGLFLPVLQGILFIIIGSVLLFPRNRYLQELLQKARGRYPEGAARVDAWREKVRARLHRYRRAE